MRRLFWLALGATLGSLIFRKISRAADKLTPQGIASAFGAGLTDLSYAIRDFADDVRSAMSAQESALRSAAGLDSPGENDITGAKPVAGGEIAG